MDCDLHRALDATQPDYAERIGFLTNLWRDSTCGAGDALKGLAYIAMAVAALWIVRTVLEAFRDDPKGSTSTLIGMSMVPLLIVSSVGVPLALLHFTKEWNLPSIIQLAFFPVGIGAGYLVIKLLIFPIQQRLEQRKSSNTDN